MLGRFNKGLLPLSHWQILVVVVMRLSLWRIRRLGCIAIRILSEGGRFWCLRGREYDVIQALLYSIHHLLTMLPVYRRWLHWPVWLRGFAIVVSEVSAEFRTLATDFVDSKFLGLVACHGVVGHLSLLWRPVRRSNVDCRLLWWPFLDRDKNLTEREVKSERK